MGTLRKGLSGLGLLSKRAFSSSAARPSSLHFEDYDSLTVPGSGPPIVIAHGMLGSSANWTSLAKAMHKKTARRVVAFDAINHGQSPHR